MSQQIKAIDTFYKGYKFRSRLEARWAVYFDALGLKWLYEDEGYKLSDGSCYLPDFKMAEYNIYIEIKPDNHDRWAYEKYEVFRNDLDVNIIIEYGLPGAYPAGWLPDKKGEKDPFHIDGLPYVIFDPNNSFVETPYDDKIIGAINAAKSARFEFKNR